MDGTNDNMYPNIENAVLIMALDNGGINCYRPESDLNADLAEYLNDTDPAFLEELEAWLSTLSEEQLDTVVSGEESEMEALCAAGPDGVNGFFNEIFSEVI